MPRIFLRFKTPQYCRCDCPAKRRCISRKEVPSSRCGCDRKFTINGTEGEALKRPYDYRGLTLEYIHKITSNYLSSGVASFGNGEGRMHAELLDVLGPEHFHRNHWYAWEGDCRVIVVGKTRACRIYFARRLVSSTTWPHRADRRTRYTRS